MNQARPILIMAGGTGGHVFPALAVAQELIKKGIPVVWLGSKRGLEARVIPANGIPIEWLTVSGMRGKSFLKLGMSFVNFVGSCVQVFFILLRVKPRMVLGMGGFVSAPGGLIAKILGRPLVIHEQNAIPGLTNRILSNIADLVLEAFPNTFKEDAAALCTGNPLREDIVQVIEPGERLEGREGPIRVLVLGGSLGAKALNDVLPNAIKTIPLSLRPLVKHQCGTANVERVMADYQALSVDAEVCAFVDDMADAYAWADLVVCRSGAMTVSEISAVGLASILIPFPYAVDDHQTVNAKLLESMGAGILINQNQLSCEKIGDLISALSVDRARLLEMANNARKLAKPHATSAVVNQCLVFAGGYDGN